MQTSRHVVLFWSFWLLGSWAISLWRYELTQASQLMMLATMVGLMLIWPAYRLAERSTYEPEREVRPAMDGVILLDWFSLLIVCQAVFWPLRMVNDWPWRQALWLNGSLAVWSLAAGLMIVWGRSLGARWSRTLAMLLCILLVFGEPLWHAVAMGIDGRVLPSEVMRYGPLAGVWVMSYEPTNVQEAIWRAQTLIAGSVALVGWVGLAMIRLSIRTEAEPSLDES